MKRLLLTLCMLPFMVYGQQPKFGPAPSEVAMKSVKEPSEFMKKLKREFKFSTFYLAYNGNNSVSDVTTYSVTDGLTTTTTSTPYDYSGVFGIRKIQRFGYEPNIQNRFKNGTENSFSDAATIGSKSKGFEYLFEFDYRRQQGREFLSQDHFLRYIADKYVLKVEYLEDGIADIGYFEASQRFRHKFNRKFSVNLGGVQRISEPYGYDPLEEWLLANGNIHFTNLAINEMGYSIDFTDGFDNLQYIDPNGEVVATSKEVWEAVIIPQVLSDYVDLKRSELPQKWEYSFVAGFDYYHYSKDFWLHSWANVMPYHINRDDEYSYHEFHGGQWVDYSGGLIFGYRFTKSLGVFTEGRYHKYWNRSWYEFSTGINFIIL